MGAVGAMVPAYFSMTEGEIKGCAHTSGARRNIPVEYFGRLYTVCKVKFLREFLHSMDVGLVWLGLVLR